MQMRIGWINTLTFAGLLGLTLTVAEAGNASSINASTTAVAQSSTTTGPASDSMRQELDQLKRQMQAIQDRIQELEKPPAEKPSTEAGRATPQPEQPHAVPAAPSPAYGNILPGVRLGGYGSFRFEGSSLKDVSDTFTYRRFVLSIDANIAERLRSGVEIELERFTELELERTTRPSNGGLGAVGAREGAWT